MKREQSAQHFLSALWGQQRVTIGIDSLEALRRLSGARQLACPGCGATVVLHAGAVRTHHFAHMPGAVCSAPQTEPETEEHRAGKLLLARWLRACLPEAQVLVEAHIPETNQRADILVFLPASPPGNAPASPGNTLMLTHNSAQANDISATRFVSPPVPVGQRIAIEYQCANLPAREWQRRHQLYHSVGIQDLWILGGSRLICDTLPTTNAVTPRPDMQSKTVLRTTELERSMLWADAPLLFLDSVGEQMPAETLARFRPDENAQALRPSGRLQTRNLLALPFPFALLAWSSASHPEAPRLPAVGGKGQEPVKNTLRAVNGGQDGQLWEWLIQRHRVTPETLSGFFGLPVRQTLAFACEARVWQAALYYRFIHRHVGDRWWLVEVETWTRAYLPLTMPVDLKRLRAALINYQEILAAAGFLSLPRGYNRVNATITDDLLTLSTPPDPQEVLRLARYRRTLAREARTEYAAQTARP